MTDVLKFAVQLEDMISPAAKKSASALTELQGTLQKAKATLAGYESQLRMSKDLGDVEGYRKYSALVSESKQSVFGLTQNLQSMSLASKDASASTGGLASMMGGPWMIAGTAALAVVTGLAAGFVELGAKAVEMALEVSATNDKLTATFDALGAQGPESGKRTLAMLDDLSGKLPQSRAQLAEWTKTLEAMGVTDLTEIRGQVVALASAQAIGGEQGSAAYLKLAERVRVAAEAHQPLKLASKSLRELYEAGINVTDVAQAMGVSAADLGTQLKNGTVDAGKFGDAMEASLLKKGKGPLAAMGNELGTLKTKGLETLGHLFDGIDTSPLTDALKSIISLGDAANPSGQALKKGIGGAVQDIIKWMGHMLTEGEVLFLTLELYAVTHQKQLENIEGIFRGIAHVIEWIVGLGDPFKGMSQTEIAAFASAQQTAASLVGPPKTAPAHATGGLVSRPAPGEFLASVAPGEYIMPAAHTRMMMGGGLGARAREGLMAGAANENARGGTHIEHLELHIDAPHGVTDATQVSATGLALALERFQLASGR